MTFTIDSSVYLSAFLEKDHFHHPSKTFLTELAKSKADILLPILIPLEVANTLHHLGLSVKKSQRVFESFFNTPGTRILSLDWAISQVFLKDIQHFHLKTADWIIAATSYYLGTTLVTWDKKLIQTTQKILKARIPLG